MNKNPVDRDPSEKATATAEAITATARYRRGAAASPATPRASATVPGKSVSRTVEGSSSRCVSQPQARFPAAA